MKLPEWGTLLRELTPSELELAEAIVRDCAKLAHECGYTSVEEEILARYGLEPK